MKKIKNLTLLTLLAPSLAFAQLNQAERLIVRAGELVLLLIKLAAGLAVLAFFWGLVKFIWKSGDEKGREEGKNIMKWGLISIFVIFTIWGIIGFFQSNLFDGYNPGSIDVPLPIPQA